LHLVCLLHNPGLFYRSVEHTHLCHMSVQHDNVINVAPCMAECIACDKILKIMNLNQLTVQVFGVWTTHWQSDKPTLRHTNSPTSYDKMGHRCLKGVGYHKNIAGRQEDCCNCCPHQLNKQQLTGIDKYCSGCPGCSSDYLLVSGTQPNAACCNVFFTMVNCCLFSWVPDTNRQPK